MSGTREDRAKRRSIWLRTLAVLGVLALFCVLHPDLTKAIMDGDSDRIITELQNTSGVKTILFLSVLQVLQFVTIVFPGMPIHIAAGILLGPVPGFFTCYLSFLAANAGVFLRTRLSSTAPNLKLPDSINRNGKARALIRRLTDEEGGMVRIVTVSILPFFPNGIIPYYAAATKMRGRDFLIGVAIGSPAPIITDCLIGYFFVSGHPFAAVLICAALFGAAALITVNQHRITSFLQSLQKSDN